MATKVTVEFFKKDSGKHYTEYVYHSDLSCIDYAGIAEEVKSKYSTSEKMSHTIEVEQGSMWNKWLVII